MTDLHCFGVLALERSADGPPGRAWLDRDAAALLGDPLAIDLQRLLPGIDALDGVCAGALFDPAELLRPGWPVHAALAELARQLPGARGGRCVVLGGSAGRMPAAALQPDPELAGGLLGLLPFVLCGASDRLAPVAAAMEQRLLDVGMAAAATALAAQAQFGIRLEHARFMSLHDLCAMTALQYRNAGLDGLWQLVETALLAPAETCWLHEAGQPVALYRPRRVRLAVPVAGARGERGRRARQYAAILTAHGIEVEQLDVADADDLIARLAAI